MSSDYTPFLFEDPVEMLLVLDDELREGRTTLHPWQIGILKDFAVESTSQSPFYANVRTNNGAGKDSKLIAPCATWLCNRYVNATSVVTSASSTQLDRQTAPRIEMLCNSLNKKFGDVWQCNYRNYKNLRTNSSIVMFVTDEEGRAEGWHPLVDGAQLGIFTSESKSITDNIFQALARGTGCTKRMDCSTPGLPMGHFFNHATQGDWRKYHITAYDCPHISQREIEEAKLSYGGESSALFKSMVLAEFATTDDMVVIAYHRVWKAIHQQTVPWFREDFNTAGLDLAAGGDENVLVIRNGNKVLKVIGFRFDDTAVTIRHLEKLFKDNGLQHPQALVFGDAGGLGKPILDQLRDRGWHNVRYVLNQGSPRDKKIYYNRGAEMWFTLNTLFEKGEILLIEDPLLQRQLSGRYYKMTTDNTIQLESKLQARAKGHCSPDRADALVLAFSGYQSKFTPEGEEKPKEPPIEPMAVEEPRYDSFTLRAHARRQAGLTDPMEAYYGGNGEQRKNITELQRMIEEHNRAVRENALRQADYVARKDPLTAALKRFVENNNKQQE